MGETSEDGQKGTLLADFLSMCRLCLTKSSVKVNIFDDNHSVALPLRIMACASLEVSSADQLPKRICDECRYQLEKSYVFRKRCKNSDTKLRRYFRQLNAGKVSHMFENSDDEEEYAESQEFFNARQQKKIQQIEAERKERERDFQTRMQNFMEEERRRFQEEESKRILEEHKILAEENGKTVHPLAGTSSTQAKNELPLSSSSSLSLVINKHEEEETTANVGIEIEPQTDLFEEEKMDEDFDEAPEQDIGPDEQNDEIEFILNDEDDIATLNGEDTLKREQGEINGEESVEYDEEEDDEDDEDLDYEKDADLSPGKTPLLLNSNLKSMTNPLGDDQIIFSLNADKSNQYIIKPGTSMKSDEIEGGEEQEVDTSEQEAEQEAEQESLDEKSPPIEDDIDFDHLTTAVRTILAQQVGLNVNGEVKFKVLKRRNNVAEVEVRTDDGTVIVMEVELDSMLKDNNGELKIFGCTQCPRAFSRKAQLQRHASTHIKEKGVSCEYCEKWFPSKSALDRHVRVHTGEKPFKCDICGKCFIQKEILKRHTMVHTGERPFKCEICGKSFIQNDMLRYHINRKHSDNPVLELRKCPLCAKTFSYASGLSRHLTVHTGKIFPCQYCSKKFNDRSAHKRHVTSVHRIVNS